VVARLRRLPWLRMAATIGTPEIPVWCEAPEQAEETIEAMIAEGEIRPDQRSRCVFWEHANCMPGQHEANLDAL
jgi:hypothetical protein